VPDDCLLKRDCTYAFVSRWISRGKKYCVKNEAEPYLSSFPCLVSSRASGVVSVWLSSSLSFSALELRETDQKPTVIIVGPTPCVCLRRRRCLPTQVPRKRGTGKSSPHCFLGLHAYASARGVVVGFVAGARTATHAAAAFSFCRDRGTRTAAWAERRVGPSWEGVDRTQETLGTGGVMSGEATQSNGQQQASSRRSRGRVKAAMGARCRWLPAPAPASSASGLCPCRLQRRWACALLCPRAAACFAAQGS
jgi:hypothetical protein